MKTKWTITTGLLVLAMMTLPLLAEPKVPTKEGVALTVYSGQENPNQRRYNPQTGRWETGTPGYAVVREIRELNIGKDGQVKFRDVASKIDATTVLFKSYTDPSAKILEQNYQYDLVNANKLLEKYIEKKISVIGEGKLYEGTLMSYDGSQIVLKEKSGEIVMVQRGDNVKDIRFSALPGGLLTKPTLLWHVYTKKPGPQLAEVMYQTGGMNWHAEYVMVLNGDDTGADLTGWVSVKNQSGKTFRDAKLKFIAGDVQKVVDQRGAYRDRFAAKRSKVSGDAAMQEKAFFEYHMYTLPRPSTVANNETKQLEMFSPVSKMKVTKKYLYNPLGAWRWSWGGHYTSRNAFGANQVSKKVGVFIQFANSKENKLGIPLPAGKFRLYKKDTAEGGDGAMEFIGEEKIDHTPKDEELSLKIGNAFDIVGERKMTNFRVDSRAHWMEETVEIKVRNHKKTDVVVRIKDPMYRWTNWNIIQTSHEKYKKLDARTVAWDLPVKADGEVVLTYTVKYTW